MGIWLGPSIFFFFEIFEFPERKVTFANPVPHYVIS